MGAVIFPCYIVAIKIFVILLICSAVFTLDLGQINLRFCCILKPTLLTYCLGGYWCPNTPVTLHPACGGITHFPEGDGTMGFTSGSETSLAVTHAVSGWKLLQASMWLPTSLASGLRDHGRLYQWVASALWQSPHRPQVDTKLREGTKIVLLSHWSFGIVSF